MEDAYKDWIKKPCCDFGVVSSYAGMTYELYHHWNDLLYTFSYPHFNAAIASTLFFFIWAPFTKNLHVVLTSTSSFLILGWKSLFFHIAIVPESVGIRKFYKAISNNYVHLLIFIIESVSMGYSYTNYFALIPVLSFLTCMFVLGTYLGFNRVKKKLLLFDGVSIMSCHRYVIYVMLISQNIL